MLKDYQKNLLERLMSPIKGIIAYHSMGSGKTLVALSALSLFPKNKLVIAPASMIPYYYMEAKKHNISIFNTEIYSYEKYLNIDDSNKQYDLIVLDEAHRLRNSKTKIYNKIKKVAYFSNKLLLLTGTAEYNQPVDICCLVSIINPNLDLPLTMTEFEERYINSKTYTLKKLTSLLEKIAKYVDIYDAYQSRDYPIIRDKIIKVPMSAPQTKVYKFLESKMPKWARRAIQQDIPLSVLENAKLNVFSSAVRQASDSLQKYDPSAPLSDSSKLYLAAQNMITYSATPYFRGIFFSNYINAGIVPYSKILQINNVNYYIFTGKTSKKNKEAIVNEFNEISPSPKILLISSSGAEGLNFIGTTLIQILEPHFNQAKINQMIWRGIRLHSHSHLPQDKRYITVEHYISTLPQRWYNKVFNIKIKISIDEYLLATSLKKEKIMQEIKSGIKHYDL